jgi:hypothetical protein
LLWANHSYTKLKRWKKIYRHVSLPFGLNICTYFALEMALLDWRHTIHHQTRSLVNQDTLLGLCDTCGRLWKQDAAIARQILKELRTTCEARKLPLYEAAGRIGPDLLSDFS